MIIRITDKVTENVDTFKTTFDKQSFEFRGGIQSQIKLFHFLPPIFDQYPLVVNTAPVIVQYPFFQK